MANNDYQIIPVPIRPGMREDIHRHAAADPGTLRYAQNVRWGDQGAAIRRYGTTEIATTVGAGQFTLASAAYPVEFLATSGEYTLCGSDGVAYSKRDADAGWRYAGQYSSCEPRGRLLNLYRNQFAQDDVAPPATAIDSAGYRFFAYATSDDYVHFVYQDPDGATVEAASIATCSRVRAVAVGTTIYVVLQRTSAAIDIYSLSAGGALTTVQLALVTLDASTDSWDCCAWTSTRWAFASLDSSTPNIVVRRMNAGTAEATVTATTNVRSSSRVSLFADTDHVWLGWSDNVTSQAARLSCYNWTGAALSSTFTSTSVFTWTGTTQTGTPPIVGTGPSATQVRVLCSIHNESGHATPDVYTWRAALATTAGTVTFSSTQYHARPVSKPFGPSGQYVVADLRVRSSLNTADAANEQPATLAICRTRDYASATTFEYVVEAVLKQDSEALYWSGGSSAADWWYSPAQQPSGNWVAPARHLLLAQGAGTGNLTTYQHCYYSFNEFAVNSTLARRDKAEALGLIHIAGQPAAVVPQSPQKNLYTVAPLTALPFTIDGVDLGFHRGPSIISLASANSTGAMTTAGVYLYCAVYKYVDGAGLVHRSPPSEPVQITLGASDDTVTWVVATIDFQRALRVEAPIVEIYRTEAGGTTLHLVNDFTGNNVGALTVTATDELSDSEISDNPILYTQASHVANDMAPACRFLRSSETRLWAAGGWDPFIVQASQIFVPGEPVLWSGLDTFKAVLPEACTGLAFQDGALLAFGSTGVYAIGTDGGPGNDGLSTFADPRLISPGIGCEEPASIVETPLGVFFRSRRGFEILPRGLGAPQPLPGVETTLETYSVVASACLHVDETAMTVQVVMRNPSNAATRTLVYDLDRQAWSVDVYPVDVAQIGVTADGRLLMASDDTSTSPAFLVESSSAKDDDAVFFQSRLTFHDLYPFGVFKEGQVNSVLARAGADGTCVLNVDVGVDGATARNVTWTIGAATTFETYREQTPVATSPRGTSIQLDVYDTSSGDAAGGASYFGFGLHLSDKDSVVNLPSAQRQ